MNFNNLLFLLGGAYIGWYLALNKRKETEKALQDAQTELSNLTAQLETQLQKNKKLTEGGADNFL